MTAPTITAAKTPKTFISCPMCGVHSMQGPPMQRHLLAKHNLTGMQAHLIANPNDKQAKTTKTGKRAYKGEQPRAKSAPDSFEVLEDFA